MELLLELIWSFYWAPMELLLELIWSFYWAPMELLLELIWSYSTFGMLTDPIAAIGKKDTTYEPLSVG
ncbi:hypothetical protein BSK61_14130 [Paenibacillus odorifer]|nr:hypothetical protein BSK61_14130 [Paenibacillus odorifer]